MRSRFNKKTNRLGSVAALVLGALSLFIGLDILDTRHALLNGQVTRGVVVGVHTGVKGLKRVEAQYSLPDGKQIIGRDIHSTQWGAANEIGEAVTLYYLVTQPTQILIDRGAQSLLNPAILIGGAVLLFALTVILWKQK